MSELQSLSRDYTPDYIQILCALCDEDDFEEGEEYHFCVEHCWHQLRTKPSEIRTFYFYQIPGTGPECTCCDFPSIYLSYVDQDFKKYTSHLKQQLEFYSDHKECTCYWPEYSQEAGQISDMAYLLFRDLISTTALSKLLTREKEQRKFIENSYSFLGKHKLTISLIAQQFWFSDYYHVCSDIEDYAIATYGDAEVAKIKDKLEDILEALYPKFFKLYSTCFAKHPSQNINQEICFMKLLANDMSGLETLSSSRNNKSFLQTSQVYDHSEFIIANLYTAKIPVE
ncbi:MAG TPA: hypothetical protein VGP47_00520 [Parachlamydiaceae bacterium]|nr:hypothetical protein [Nitrosopumilus sp.]HEV8050948.1 hypothetical protein [Parachlamydiaceae bacterium]